MNSLKHFLYKFSRIFFIFLSLIFINSGLFAQRIPVLSQIDLPHNYYYRELYLPQLTSGPSSVAWLNNNELVFSMSGSLWKQDINAEAATQLTDGDGYDYQPDISPDGKKIVFVRYTGTADELVLLDIETNKTVYLTNNNAVNLEPRWSPDGKKIVFVSTINTGHFLLFKADINNYSLSNTVCLTPDKKSEEKRYYYSPYNHAINPVWSHDGKKIFFVSNNEIAHGTGDIVCMELDSGKAIKTIQHEETNWRIKPDISPDGTRLVYSSYLGRNWHQLWLLPSIGGYPMPLTYGEYDNTNPRWSPDGKVIAFISNRDGNIALYTINMYTGEEKKIIPQNFKFLKPHSNISVIIQDENSNEIPCRVSVYDENGKAYSPLDSWMQADDSRFTSQKFETNYFHANGNFTVSVPQGKIFITASHGPEYEIEKMQINASSNSPSLIILKIKRLKVPVSFGRWQSGDLHVHMNYTGSYLASPARLMLQAKAENLNYVFNLIVNKEQRIPDIKYFSNKPDKISDASTTILYGQEFHTSYWGHLDLLNLQDHIILPGYAGYPYTAASSIYPHNGFIEDEAHKQNAMVGYAHPFDSSEIFPQQSPSLTNELPVDAALGKVDFYELVGFADHKASEAVWYHLLNCGLHIPAGAGTDAMTDYASLRGPVGLNRVYVKQDGPVEKNLFLENVKAGKSFVTNGPLIGLTVNGKEPGDTITVNDGDTKISYATFLRSNIPVEYFELVFNGNIVAKLTIDSVKKQVDANGSIKLKGPGWLLLRAWSKNANPDLPDMYAYASTNPIYINVPGKKFIEKESAEFFIEWVQRLKEKVLANKDFRTEEERKSVLDDIEKAEKFYRDCEGETK